MKNWVVKKLGEVYDVRDGTHDSPKYVKEGYALITSKNLKNDSLNYDNVNYITEQDYISINKRSKVDVGDVLFAMIGTIGNPIVIKDEPDFAIKNVALFKVPKNQDSHFLKYYLDSSSVIEKMSKDAKGATQKFVGLGYLRNFEIPLPPLPEQQHIVSILDEAFAAIAKAKANAEQNLKNAKELFESYLQGVFEKKGDGWETEKFVNLCNLITCGVAATPKYVDESIGVPFLSAQNVRNGEVVLDKFKYISKEFHQELTKKNKPQKGDILYSRVGAKYGEAGVVEHDFEFSVYVSVTLIKPKPEKLDNYFLKHLLNSPAIKEVARKSISSSGVPNLNVNDVREFLISYPSITIQKRIVSEIETMRSETQKLETVYQKKIDDLEELKKSVLQKAFAGELKTENNIAL